MMLVTIRSNHDAALSKYAKAEGVVYPYLVLPELWDDLQKLPLKSALLHQPRKKTSYEKWYCDILQWLGLVQAEMDHELSSDDEGEERDETIVEKNVPSSRALFVSAHLHSIRESIECIRAFIEVLMTPSLDGFVSLMFLKDRLRPTSMVAYETSRNEQQSEIIRAFAWHRYKQIFAVAHRSDAVLIYDLNRERKKKTPSYLENNLIYI
jgi:hypothetical protein